MESKNNTALVVEGGGMRGIFSAGVLDAFQEKNFMPFNAFYGVSAGACNLASFLAGQFGRNLRVYTELMTRKEFINPWKFIRGKHWMDLDWLWDEMDRIIPLDTSSAAAKCKKENLSFNITVTAADSGKALYLKPDKDTMNHYLKASSAVPLLYRNFPVIDNTPCTDGGIGDSIPVRRAYSDGAAHITVIRSRPSNYEKKHDFETKATASIFRNYPGLQEAIRRRPDNYMNSVRFIISPPEGPVVHQIAPEKGTCGRLTRSVKDLLHDYREGLEAGKKYISAYTLRYTS